MESIYECTRCGSLYKQQVSPDVWVCRKDTDTSAQRLNLCPDCQKQLEKWLSEAAAE